MPKIKRLDTVLGQVLPCQSDPISIVFITRGIIFIFGNCRYVQSFLIYERKHAGKIREGLLQVLG